MVRTEGAHAPYPFQEYVGRTETLHTRITEAPVHLLAALLDRRFDEISPKRQLPPLWHFLITPDPVLQSEIGPDGHPKRGTFLPPITFPRRMFAGSFIKFFGELRLGDEIVRITTIKSVTPKLGRSGNLLFVTLTHTLEGPRGIALTEEQNLVFRETDGPEPVSTAGLVDRELPSHFSAIETINPDAALLFRYSAATSNTHRIHYDLEYVRKVERYPNLVVHGPLQAIMLAGLAERQLRRPLSAFEFRIVKPLFLGAPFHCVARTENGKQRLKTLDISHDACTTAWAE